MPHMRISDAEVSFDVAVKKAFETYLVPLGFQLEKEHLRIFVAWNEHCRLTIALELGTVDIDVEGADNEIWLEYALRALASDEGYISSHHEVLRSPASDAVDLQVRAFVKNCTPVIEGDLDAWNTIQANLEAVRQGNRQYEPPFRTLEQHLSEISERIVRSYADKSYYHVTYWCKVAKMLGGKLNADEKRMLHEARMQEPEGFW